MRGMVGVVTMNGSVCSVRIVLSGTQYFSWSTRVNKGGRCPEGKTGAEPVNEMLARDVDFERVSGSESANKETQLAPPGRERLKEV